MTKLNSEVTPKSRFRILSLRAERSNLGFSLGINSAISYPDAEIAAYPRFQFPVVSVFFLDGKLCAILQKDAEVSDSDNF